MTAPVEARSLSSLTTLFANPPQYPRNPTHQVLEPLVLYIVRVPGSEDIFLTPLKPHSKASISAEAIQSSLYYFHVVTPEDEVVRESLEDHRRPSGLESGSRPEAIHRKPLPSSPLPAPSASGSLPTPTSDPPQFQPPRSERENPAHAGIHGEHAGTHDRHSPDGVVTIPRKPVGPRLRHSTLKTADRVGLERKPVHGSEGDGNTRQGARTDFPDRRGSSEFPADGRADVDVEYTRSGRRADVDVDTRSGRRADVDVEYTRSGLQQTGKHLIPHGVPVDLSAAPPLPPRPSYSSPERGTERGFCVTIIRRDPTSGSQWNIGRLFREQGPAFTEPSPLRIEITTPGYQKFARPLHFPAPDPQAFKQAIAEKRDGADASDEYGAISRASRPTWTHFQPALFTRNIITRPASSQPQSSPHQHQRSRSSESFPFSLPQPSLPGSATAPPHLTFTSLWQGTCTFTTGMNGRSLKCRHRLPSSSTQPDPSSSSSASNIVVAELRFNLPWSPLRSRDGNSTPTSSTDVASATAAVRQRRPTSLIEDGRPSAFLKKGMARIRAELHSSSASDHDVRTSLPFSSTSFSKRARIAPENRHHHHHHHQYQHHQQLSSSSSSQPLPLSQPTSDSDSSTSSSRLDLKLGRERAGGGRKGKSAKLGKLVVRDEGLKMADLVVAACVGVWWGVYDGGGGVRRG